MVPIHHLDTVKNLENISDSSSTNVCLFKLTGSSVVVGGGKYVGGGGGGRVVRGVVAE